MNKKTYWTIGFIISLVVVIFSMYYMFIYRVQLTLPKFTFEAILVMLVFSFPCSYFGRWCADFLMKQSTHIGDVFKETVIGTAIHWIMYLPLLMIYNYIVFGELMEFPSLQAVKDMIPSGNYIFLLPALIVYYPPIVQRYAIIPILKKIYKRR